MTKFLFSAVFLSALFQAQVPAGYYDGTTGLTGYALKTKLHDIISNKTVNWHYGDLTNYYNQTDLDQYYDHGVSNTTLLLDIYSEIPTGTDSYEYTTAQIIGSAGSEGLGWNREHMMPQSTFYSNYPMYSDLFYVVPTDARINQLRSNYPYGVAGTTTYYTFSNTSRIGNSAIPNYVYTGRVYEPIDEFKGDVARSLLYFAVRYEGKLGTFNYNNNTNPASDTNPLDGNEERAFEPAYLAMLLQWHTQDPVSQREIDRNNAVYNLQKNRNPFIDNPSWVSAIWSQTPDSVAPDAPSNLTVSQNSAYFVNLNWNVSSSSDVIGYKIYQNGTLVGVSKTNSFTVDHLTPSTAYNFTVKAYDNGYLYSSDSNSSSTTTLATDVYAKDLYVSKYLEGSSNNKALEITNKTGHAINLSDYRLSIQYSSGSSYYFPDPFELEGTVQNNESFVVVNPNANFTCFTVSQAKIATAAPQMTFSGSNYIELRYKSSTVDGIGVMSQSNTSVLANVSLYRKSTVTNPTTAFDINEWNIYGSDYCQDLGTLSTSEVVLTNAKELSIYPNPVSENLFVNGDVETVKNAMIYDYSGKLLYSEKQPFKNKKNISVQTLESGNYILNLDGQSFKFIKK